MWSTYVAAYTFFNNLPSEVRALGGALLARAAATLVAVGRLIVSALNLLIEYIISLVNRALSLAFNPLILESTNYELNLNTTTTSVETDVQSSQTGYKVTSAHASAWYAALGGSVFQTGFGTGTGLEILLTLIAPFSIGPVFIATLIIPMLLNTPLEALEGTIHLTSSLPLTSAITTYLVDAIWSLTNATIGAGNALESVFFAASTQLVAEVAAGFAAFFGFAGYLWNFLYTDSTAASLLVPGMVCALAFVALWADLTAHSQHSKNLGWLGVGIGGFGATIGGYYAVKGTGSIVGLRGIDVIGAALSTYACLAGLAVVSSPDE